MEADISTQAVGLASSADFSLMNLFLRADIIVKSVIIILIAWYNIEHNIFDLFYGTKTKQSDVSDSDKIIFREITEKDCSDIDGEAKEACLRNNQEYYRRQDMDDDIYA